MEPRKELEPSEDSEGRLLPESCHFPSRSSSSPNERLLSAPDDGMPDKVLSSESSQCPDSMEHLKRCLVEQQSLRRVLQTALGCNSLTSIGSNGSPIPKPAADLIEEIAVLEAEVIHLEQHLLSLYRTAFNYQLGSLSSAVSKDSSSLVQGSGTERINVSVDSNRPSIYNDSYSDVISHSYSLEHIEKQRNSTEGNSEIYDGSGTGRANFDSNQPSIYNYSYSDVISHSYSLDHIEKQKNSTERKPEIYEHQPPSICSTSTYSQKPNHKSVVNQNAGLGPRSLADHLGASLADLLPETPNRLSEEIIRCISSIYCKLSDPPLTQIGVSSASPTSSLSSSSIFSPLDHCDNWSLQCNNDESLVNPFGIDDFKVKQGPYVGMLQISKLSLDDDTFNYAATMLQNFRLLIQRLEKVDPSTMKHEEKLAFWINIHNALVMHAHLAYGIPRNKKMAHLSHKAGYSIGGHSINAYVIESSILGCCSHHPSLWLRTLLSPLVKSRTENGKHVYALQYPEPLVHFALCSGGYSDPVVRVYTPKNIFQELKLAREEFIQVTVSIHKEKKIILPKVLYYYGKDASMDVWRILEIVSDCLQEAEKKCVERCLRERIGKSFKWAPYNAAFRYIMHRELLKG